MFNDLCDYFLEYRYTRIVQALAYMTLFVGGVGVAALHHIHRRLREDV